MTNKLDGIVEIHGAKQKERGFNCMQLIAFLTSDSVKEWDRWHGAHIQAASGNCPYTQECPIHERTVNHRVFQLPLF